MIKDAYNIAPYINEKFILKRKLDNFRNIF